jgi:CDP-diacylglycerol--glycerol-3-phosphate 3-phosphatidyltransferase
MSIIDRKAREYSRPMLEAIGRTLARWNVSPNLITLLGMVVVAGVAVLAGLGEMRWAGLAYLFSALFDALDGTLARISGQVSRFGAFFDSTIDRFEESIVFLGLTYYYAISGSWWEAPLVLLATVGSLMVSYTRARSEAVGINCKVGFMTRVPRVAIMIIGMLLDQVPIALGILVVTTFYTTFHRMYHVWKASGGGPAGWEPVADPYSPPVSGSPQAEEDAGSEGAEPEAAELEEEVEVEEGQ